MKRRDPTVKILEFKRYFCVVDIGFKVKSFTFVIKCLLI